jgi:hypothetical protein
VRGIKLFCLVVLTATLVVALPRSASGAAEFIPPVIAQITRQFDMSSGEFGAGHRGVDFAVPEGTPVLASGAGTVTFAGSTPEGPYVTVRHDGDVETTYALGRIDVSHGQQVNQGEVLGVSGKGHAGSPVVHFGAKVAGKYVDPMMLLRDFDDITDLIGLAQVPEEPPARTVTLRPVTGPVFGAGGVGGPGLEPGINPGGVKPGEVGPGSLTPEGLTAGPLGVDGVGAGDVASAQPGNGSTAGGFRGSGIPPETLFVPPLPDITADAGPILDLDKGSHGMASPDAGPSLRGPRLPSKFFEEDGFDGEGGVGFGLPFDPKTGLPQFKDPRRIREWWVGLTDEERKGFVKRFPRQIGHMVGIPVADRDEANRLWLERRIEKLREMDAALKRATKPFPFLDSLFDYKPPDKRPFGRFANAVEGFFGMTPVQRRLTALRRELLGAENLRKQLRIVAERKRNRLDVNSVYLLEVDTSAWFGDGRAAIALGDPSAADHIGVVVPGINSALHKIEGTLDDAAMLRASALEEHGDAFGEAATIAWLGYDAPNGLADATNEAEARDGAPRLVKFVHGLRIGHQAKTVPLERRSRKPHVSVYGHSYGSVVSGMAAKLGLDFKDLAIFGSPGGGVEDGKELYDPDRQIWSTRTPDDIILLATLVPVLGQDPVLREFGAKNIPLGPEQTGHDGYWEWGSLGVRNFAAILVGAYDRIAWR